MRWPYVLLAIAGVSAAIATVVVVAHVRGNHDATAVTETRDAARPLDAAVMAFAEDRLTQAADAAAAPSPSPDAATAADVPAGSAVGAKTAVARHPATFAIEVLAQPGDAEIFVDGHHRGRNGVRIEEAWGKSLVVECKAPHYYGRKTLVFDGSASSAHCVATRIPMCVEGLKNPYDVCEERDGSAAPVETPPP
jgi:hypothetical protein